MDKYTSVTKFVIDTQCFYVKTNWQPNENDLFHIKLYDGDKTWSGRFSYEFAKKYTERFDETKEEYCNDVKRGLAKHPDFSYSFVVQTDDKASAIFSWKKKFEDSQHEFAILVHGSVPVHIDQEKESKDLLLDFLLAENKDLQDIIKQLSTKNSNLEKDLYRCRCEMNNFVDIKTSLETSLYGKFVQLLTAKKRRIQILQDNISYVPKTNKTQQVDELD